MQTLTNQKNLPLTTAVWLAHDTYDRVVTPDYISATGVIRPLKQIILAMRVDPSDQITDVSDLVASRMGQSIHDSIERAWLSSYERALKNLGYPQNIIDRVIVNPTPDQLAQMENPIPVYLEQRRIKELMGFKIGGKFDIVAEGTLEDYKSTKVFTYVKGSNHLDYILQGSIYRWLNPEIITNDVMRINYIFTDWLKSRASYDPNYPKTPIISKTFPLMSLQEIESWMLHKLTEIKRLQHAPEEQLPPCTDEELWRTESTWKYYSDPAKLSRATKNFETQAEANSHMITKGKGIVIQAKGMVKRCNYCPAFTVCKQKDQYLADGSLAVEDE